jgi:hypothetical protein
MGDIIMRAIFLAAARGAQCSRWPKRDEIPTSFHSVFLPHGIKKTLGAQSFAQAGIDVVGETAAGVGGRRNPEDVVCAGRIDLGIEGTRVLEIASPIFSSLAKTSLPRPSSV